MSGCTILKSRIVLIGPPACGKGTQASLLSAAFSIPHVSTGEILRQERLAGSPIGLEADRYAREGHLFPDDLALRVVRQWMDNRARFIFDGFPRTIGQAIEFDKMLFERGIPLDVVYLLEISDDEVLARMLGRLTCSKCGAVYNTRFHDLAMGDGCPKCQGSLVRRTDDTREALEHRLSEYKTFTQPVADYYTAKGLLKAIDVEAARDEVFQMLYADMKEEAL